MGHGVIGVFPAACESLDDELVALDGVSRLRNIHENKENYP